MNYTVVDPTSACWPRTSPRSSRRHADELLTREEVNNLLEQLKQKAPKLVEDTIPAIVKPIDLQKILQNLLRERVPIRDMETILETLADWGRAQGRGCPHRVRPQQPPPHHLLQYASPDDGRLTLTCVTLDPALEEPASVA
jgi:hypothetical protein